MLSSGTKALCNAAVPEIQAQTPQDDSPFSLSAVIVNRRLPLYGQSQLYPDLKIQFKGRAAIFAARRLAGWSGQFSVREYTVPA